MSKEFITWQQAATKLNKSTGNTRTEWPTKSQLVTFGADSAKLQKYTAAEFVAEEDVSATTSVYIKVAPMGSLSGFTFTDEGIIDRRQTYECGNSRFPSMADPTGIRLSFKVQPSENLEGDITATCPSKTGIRISQLRLSPPELSVIFDLEGSRPNSMHDFIILLEGGGVSTVIRCLILVVA